MADSATNKRSPTTPSTPGVWNGAQSKKFKREETESPTKPHRSRDTSVEELTRQHIIDSRELQRLRGLIKFLEVERKVQGNT